MHFFNILIIFLAGFSSLVHADPVAGRFEETMEAHAETGRFSGAALLARDGEIIFEAAYGCFNTSCSRMNTVNTPFNIGSIGKMFSQVLALERVEEGIWTLDTTVAEIWPESGLENADTITIEHLLTHVSGMDNYFVHPEYSNAQRTTDDFIALARTEERRFAPGEGFWYSNTAFWVLGKLLELTDPQGRTWSVQFQEDVFDAANMDGVRFFQPDEDHAARPQGFHRSAAGEMNPLEDLPRPGPDGGEYATVRDLFALSEAIDNGLWYREELRAQAETPGPSFNGLPAHVGLTWEIFEDRGMTYVTKGGTLLGSGGELVRFSHDGHDYTIVLLANLSNAPLVIFRDVAAYTLGLEAVELPGIPASEQVHAALERGEPVLTDVRGWADSAGIERPAAALSRLGRHYARNGNATRAEALLAALQREYPGEEDTERLRTFLAEAD